MASFSQDPTWARPRPSHSNSVSSGQQVLDASYFLEGQCQDGHTGFQHGSALSQTESSSLPDQLFSGKHVQTKDAWTTWGYGTWSAERLLAAAENDQSLSTSRAWESTQFHSDSVPRFNYEEHSNTDQQYVSSRPSVLPFESHSDISIQESLWTEYPASDCAVPNQIGEFQQPHLQPSYNHSSAEDSLSKAPMSVSHAFTKSPNRLRDHLYAENAASTSWNSSPTTAGAVDTRLHQDGLNESVTSNINAQDTAAWCFQVREPSSPLVNLASHYPPWSTEGIASGSLTHTITSPTDLVPEPPTTMVDPSTEDMNPENTKMTPQRSNLKDPNHLYMPRWIRGHGKHREGWCGACRPGRWLSLKRSTYWYHKNFFHGITVAGTTFPRPTRVQQLRDEKGWEGLCGTCDKWVALHGGKKNQTSWFRHAYKCGSFTPRASPSKALFC